MKSSNNNLPPPAASPGSEQTPLLDREQDLQLWSAKKWTAVTPPMRPSAEDMSFYEKELLGSRPAPGAEALILGSTPELRSLALKHRLRTVGCDIDAGFWAAMTLLRTVEGEEEFIHGNWLDLVAERRYDLILGDCASNMLSWDETKVFIPKLGGLLKEHGISIQRILTANESLTLDTIDQAMVSYRERDPGISLNLYLFFLAESLRNNYHPEMTNREFFESAVFPRLTPEEIARLRPFLIDRKFCYPRLRDMTALIEETFTIVRAEESSGTGTWGTARMVVLKKKNE